MSRLPLKRLAALLAAVRRRARRRACAKLATRAPGEGDRRRSASREDLRARASPCCSTSGLGYLSLERSTPTLSPGELQRLRLATQVRSNLFGVVYVLDEPSAGLHPADTEALLARARPAQGRGQLAVRGRARAGRDPPRRLDRRRRPGRRASTAAQVLYSGPPDGPRATSRQSQTRALPVRRRRAAAPRTPRAPQRLAASCDGVTRNNLHGLDVALPARRVHRR